MQMANWLVLNVNVEIAFRSENKMNYKNKAACKPIHPFPRYKNKLRL